MKKQITRIISIAIITFLFVSMVSPGMVRAEEAKDNSSVTGESNDVDEENEGVKTGEKIFSDKEDSIVNEGEKSLGETENIASGAQDESAQKDSRLEGETSVEEDEYYAEENNLANSWRYSDGKPISSKARSGQYTTWPEVEGAVGYGIDVSYHNGKIDWLKAKNAGVDYAIIRCGYGMDEKDQDDSKWETNADACEKYGIPYGTYIYSYATTTTRAKSEADHVLRLIKGRDLDYPVYFDMEDITVESLSAKKKGDIAEAFCDRIEAAGYEVAIYANKNWFTNYLTDSRFDQWDKWVAQYNTVCDYKGEYTMWQCSSKGRVDGIKGNVDLNVDYGAGQTKGYTLYETTDTVNYRSGPGTTYTREGTLRLGMTISVENGYSKSANGYTWFRFRMGGKNYYVASKYLKKTTKLEKPDVECGNRVLDGKPTLKWDNIGADYYETYRAEDENGTYSKMFTTENLSYTNTSAVAGQTYYYKVRAIYASGETVYSDIYENTAICGQPEIEKGNNSSGLPTLKWEPAEGAAKYEVYRICKSAYHYGNQLHQYQCGRRYNILL